MQTYESLNKIGLAKVTYLRTIKDLVLRRYVHMYVSERTGKIIEVLGGHF